VVGTTGGNEVGNPITEHPGFTRPGAGHDQQRRASMLNCFLLLGVQTLQELCGIQAVASVALPFRSPVHTDTAARSRSRSYAFRRRFGAGSGGGSGFERSVRVRVKQHIHDAYKSRRWGRHPLPACGLRGQDYPDFLGH
jgi:hypothetical protein